MGSIFVKVHNIRQDSFFPRKLGIFISAYCSFLLLFGRLSMTFTVLQYLVYCKRVVKNDKLHSLCTDNLSSISKNTAAMLKVMIHQRRALSEDALSETY